MVLQEQSQIETMPYITRKMLNRLAKTDGFLAFVSRRCINVKPAKINICVLATVHNI